jgi:hypothetical protein
MAAQGEHARRTLRAHYGQHLVRGPKRLAFIHATVPTPQPCPDARTYFAEIVSVAVLITLLENAEFEQVSTARTSVVTDIETAVQAFRKFLNSFIAASGAN